MAIKLKHNEVFENQVSNELLGIVKKFNSNTWKDIYSYPILNFNKVYYKLIDDKLTAFKIKMCIFNKSAIYNWTFVVEFPNGEIKYINDFLVRNDIVFNSKEDFFNYLQGNKCGFRILTERENNSIIGNTISFYNTYVWDNKSQKPKPIRTPILGVILNENGFNYILENVKGAFRSAEECLKHKLNGLVIEEFPQETNINSLFIQTTSITPLIRTLTFIEK